MTLFIDSSGSIKGVIGSLKKDLPIDPSMLGRSTVKRQGVIIQDETGLWWADMFLTGNGEILGPCKTRDQIIQAEIDWLNSNIL